MQQHRPDGRDAGESLLEILMAVAIMGIAFAALLAGLGTAVATSAINADQAEDTNYVRALAESVEATPFETCAGAAHYESGMAQVPVPAGSTRNLAVSYWDAATSSWRSACSPSTQLHRVSITTAPADARAGAPAPLEVVRRKP